MIEPIENLYQQIGQAVVDSIEDEWRTAWLEVDFKPGVITMCGHYRPTIGDAERSFRPARTLVALFNQLHEVMVAEMNADWKTTRLDLSRDGKFNLDFTY